MRAVEAVIEIPAPAAAVWSVLTDFPRYPEWAAYIQRLEGRAEPGARLRLVLGSPGADEGFAAFNEALKRRVMELAG